MTDVFSPELRDVANSVARELGFELTTRDFAEARRWLLPILKMAPPTLHRRCVAEFVRARASTILRTIETNVVPIDSSSHESWYENDP